MARLAYIPSGLSLSRIRGLGAPVPGEFLSGIRTRGLTGLYPAPIYTPPPPVGPITGIVVDEHIYGVVDLAWGAPVTDPMWGATQYDLELSLDGGIIWPLRLLDAEGGPASYAADLSLHALGSSARMRLRTRTGDFGSPWLYTPVFILRPAVARWDLTLFDEDGVPVLGEVDGDGNVIESSFSTHPAHPRPWLDWPKDAVGSEVDFLKGKVKIGQFNVTVLDKRSVPTDQSTGQVTALLGPYEGLNGLRCVLSFTPLDSPQVLAMDGPCVDPTMHSSFAGYTWAVQDENKRTRKVRAFDTTGTTCIFPRGPLAPYGKLPSGQYAIPAAPVLFGTYEGDGTQGQVWTAPGMSEHSRVLTSAMANAVKFVWDEKLLKYVMENAVVRWRPAAGGAWTTLTRMPSYEFTGWLAKLGRSGELFRTRRDDIRVHDPDGEERTYQDVDIIRSVRLHSGAGALPADGQEVQLQVIYTGPASEDYPLLWDGTAGEFLAACLDGDFCSEPLDVRYDPDVVLAYVQQCSARISAPEDDLLGWLEKSWYQPLASAPTLDDQGRISPVHYYLPDENTELVTLDDANCKPDPDWKHPDSTIINEPSFLYFRDLSLETRDDPTGLYSNGDGIAAKPIRIIGQEDPANPVSHKRVGAKPNEIKTELFRAVGRPDGTSLSGEAASESGHVIGKERVNQFLDRFILGVQTFSVLARRADVLGVRIGGWVECGMSWLPDYIAGTRGMNRVAQVVGRKELDPVSTQLILQDGGNALAPLARPTVGVAVENAAGGVSLPVTAVIAGTEALVEYAISLLQPAHDSKLWTPAGRTSVPATLSTPPLPAGASVWIGARSVLRGRRPSLRTTPPAHVVLATTPRVTGVRVDVDADGVVTVSWTPNAYALGVRVFYIAQPSDLLVDPTVSLDVDAALGQVTLPIVATIGQRVTADVQPWSGFVAGAATGAAGPIVRAQGGLGPGPIIKSYTLAQNGASGEITDMTVSLDTSEVRVYARNGASPLDLDGTPDPAYLVATRKPQNLALIPFLVTDGDWQVVMRAHATEDRFTQVLDVLEVTGLGDDGGVGGPGTEIPTSAPPTPRITTEGPLLGPKNVLVALIAETVYAAEVEYYLFGTLDDTVPLAVGDLVASLPYDVTPFKRVKARVRYVGPGGPSPWSGFTREVVVNDGTPL